MDEAEIIAIVNSQTGDLIEFRNSFLPIREGTNDRLWVKAINNRIAREAEGSRAHDAIRKEAQAKIEAQKKADKERAERLRKNTQQMDPIQITGQLPQLSDYFPQTHSITKYNKEYDSVVKTSINGICNALFREEFNDDTARRDFFVTTGWDIYREIMNYVIQLNDDILLNYDKQIDSLYAQMKVQGAFALKEMASVGIDLAMEGGMPKQGGKVSVAANLSANFASYIHGARKNEMIDVSWDGFKKAFMLPDEYDMYEETLFHTLSYFDVAENLNKSLDESPSAGELDEALAAIENRMFPEPTDTLSLVGAVVEKMADPLELSAKAMQKRLIRRVRWSLKKHDNRELAKHINSELHDIPILGTGLSFGSVIHSLYYIFVTQSNAINEIITKKNEDDILLLKKRSNIENELVELINANKTEELIYIVIGPEKFNELF